MTSLVLAAIGMNGSNCFSYSWESWTVGLQPFLMQYSGIQIFFKKIYNILHLKFTNPVLKILQVIRNICNQPKMHNLSHGGLEYLTLKYAAGG